MLGQIDDWASTALALTAVGSLWGAAIWTFGLGHACDVSRGAAATTALVVTGLVLLGGVL